MNYFGRVTGRILMGPTNSWGPQKKTPGVDPSVSIQSLQRITLRRLRAGSSA